MKLTSEADWWGARGCSSWRRWLSQRVGVGDPVEWSLAQVARQLRTGGRR